jgi:hypothetical protein
VRDQGAPEFGLSTSNRERNGRNYALAYISDAARRVHIRQAMMEAEAMEVLAMRNVGAQGVMMFRSTCHNELEELSRDGSRWFCKKWCGDGALSRTAERELGVIGPLCDRNHNIHVSYDIILVIGRGFCSELQLLQLEKMRCPK